MQLTVEEIYSRLVNDDKILTKKGRITFSLGDIDIIVRQRDVVGNIMQEWIEGWLRKNGIEYALNDNTQMPPDFYLNPENKTEELMEIKAFNYKAGPGFLRIKFQEELDALGLKKLSVNLTDAGTSRGQAFMQLKLFNNNSVSDVLSEGEQKGVALALFIAERRMQLSQNPIILDDPVNSLDHFITAKLVERLSRLGNQIIIFSHNLLLQTSLVNLRGIHECGVNQKSSCGKPTKHLFMYSVTSHNRDKKGVITEKKQDNVANNLKNAQNLLNRTPFSDDCSIMVGAILRHTIELIIDEKIFNNQIPVKFHGRKNTIQWEQLKTLNPDVTMIDKLNGLFSRLSGGDLHSGIEQSDNPIDHDELEEIYNELATI